jgi:hypothetical protein
MEAQTRDRRRKAAVAMRKIWGIEKTIWRKKWKTRYDSMTHGMDSDGIWNGNLGIDRKKKNRRENS